MMEMECFSVYTQKIHSSDPRSFIHCFIYKLHLMSSWAHLNRDKLIAWEFFYPVCTTSARLLEDHHWGPCYSRNLEIFSVLMSRGVQSNLLVFTETTSKGHWIWNLFESKNNLLTSWGCNKKWKRSQDPWNIWDWRVFQN